MTYESIVDDLVCKLNSKDKTIEHSDKYYNIVRWFGVNPSHKRFALYCMDKLVDCAFGLVAFTRADVICYTDEEAYAALLKDYMEKKLSIKIDFDSAEELKLKLAIIGISL